MSNVKQVFIQGVWKNNPSLVQLLGLCPLLAVSNSATNALGLGLATCLVLICTNGMVAFCRSIIANEIRIPIFVLIIATTVTAVQLIINALNFNLYQSLGIFIPLIVTNCIVIGRAEAFASKNTLWISLVDGFAMGIGITLALLILGGGREIIGTGELFAGIETLFGNSAKVLHLQLIKFENPFLFAIQPVGAFIGLALILAVKNLFEQKR